MHQQLDQQVVLETGEDLDAIARDLVGSQGLATYEVLGVLPGDQWPTIRFTGTTHQLAAVVAHANGSAIGRLRR